MRATGDTSYFFESLGPAYFLTPRTASFAAFATRNLTTVFAGILIFCCVLGLMPVRAFLFCFTSFPKPGKTNSPFFLISLWARLERVSRNTPAVLLSVFVAVARAVWSSVLSFLKSPVYARESRRFQETSRLKPSRTVLFLCRCCARSFLEVRPAPIAPDWISRLK